MENDSFARVGIWNHLEMLVVNPIKFHPEPRVRMSQKQVKLEV